MKKQLNKSYEHFSTLHNMKCFDMPWKWYQSWWYCLISILQEYSNYLFYGPIVFLLDSEEEWDNSKAADGKNVAKPDCANAGDTEQAEEHHCDDIVPDE